MVLIPAFYFETMECFKAKAFACSDAKHSQFTIFRYVDWLVQL